MSDAKVNCTNPFNEGIDGVEKERIPLSTINISYIFCPLNKLKNAVNIQMFSAELNIQEEKVLNDLNQLISNMIDNITCIIEYPYIDEYYRDAYYSFYSRKHNIYNRNCFRISFFVNEVNEENFYDIDLENKYLGYAVLQPTPKCIIGYTFLNPSIYKDCNFMICLCCHDSFIKGRKVSTSAFPYSGQDTEIKSCAENSLLMIFDYFSRRYNRYARVLPSQIADELTDSINNRQQPTRGVDIDTVVSILNIYGITTRKYNKVISNDENENNNCFAKDKFLRILDIYVDSGFPIFMSTDSHALLAIGREISDDDGDYGHTLIAMNDNERPYSRYTNINNIQSFVVPIADNIMIDPRSVNVSEILKNLYSELISEYPNIKFLHDQTDYYYRIYLTTSRSFKNHIVKSSMSNENRELIICTAMPKFIWVCECIAKENLKKKFEDSMVDTFLVIDATDAPSANNKLLIIKSLNYLFIPVHDKTEFRRKIYSGTISNERIHPFMNNLKGKHSSWKG